MFETLEARGLLATFTPFAININFQTPFDPTVPPGYRADTGAPFGRRANGFTYGWSADKRADALNRNDPRSPDERYDTLNYLGDGQTWSIAVPAGAYQVRVVAGDPKLFNSVFRINAENVIVTEGTPTTSRRWVEGTTIVAVTDGALTIEGAAGGVNNKLNFLEIRRVEPPAAPPPTPGALRARTVSTITNAVTWSDASAEETGFRIERKRGTIGSFMPIATVRANVTSFIDTNLRPDTKYTYRVRAFNAAGASAASASDPARTFAASGSSIIWETLAPSPITRSEHQAAVVDGKLYVFGGFLLTGPVARSDVYDPITNAWTPIADLPRRVTHGGTAVDDVADVVYIAGGYVGTGGGFEQDFATTDVWKYDVKTNTWSAGPPLPAPRGAGAMVRLGRELHYLGGADLNRVDRSDHWILNLDNPASGWATAAPIPAPRNHVAAEVMNGVLYVIGGQTGTNDATGNHADVYAWDQAGDAWTSRASLPTVRSHISEATAVAGGRLFVAGGITAGGSDIADVHAYDPSANTWTAYPDLPGERFSGALSELEGVLYFVGGSNQATMWRGVFIG